MRVDRLSAPKAASYRPDSSKLTLANQVLSSPIRVDRPPNLADHQSLLKVFERFLTYLPPAIQAIFTFSPDTLNQFTQQTLQQLTYLTQLMPATDVSGQHVQLFGHPQLDPERPGEFRGVVMVADKLAMTHHQLYDSTRQEGLAAAESIVFLKSLILRLFEKITEQLTRLLAEQASLRETRTYLDLSSPYTLVNRNRQVFSPQVTIRLQEIDDKIRDREKCLMWLNGASHVLSSATTLPQSALRLSLGGATIQGSPP